MGLEPFHKKGGGLPDKVLILWVKVRDFHIEELILRRCHSSRL